MKKIDVKENFLKDIVFNAYTYKKYLFFDKLLLIGTVCLNVTSFFLYSITGNLIFNHLDFYLRLINIFLITSIFAIYHRVNVNYFNLSQELFKLDYTSYYSTDVVDVEILPLNFVFNENMPLKELKKIYKGGSYVVISTIEREFIFKMQDSGAYLVEEGEIEELEEVKKLRFTR